MFAHVVLAADTTAAAVAACVESCGAQGAAGVVLAPTTSPGAAGAPPADLISGAADLIAVAAGLMTVIVAVDSDRLAEAALSAGATGVMAPAARLPQLPGSLAEREARMWLTDAGGALDLLEELERPVLECDVSQVREIARRLRSVGSFDAVQIACPLPGRGSVPGGVIEAIVTLAVAGGATMLRCGGANPHGDLDPHAHGAEVRLVRRCADVAAALSHADAACAGVHPGGRWVPGCAGELP